MVTLEEAKAYLRVDSNFEDALVESLILAACAICTDVARLSQTEWEAIAAYTGDDSVSIRGEEKEKGEVLQMQNLLRCAVLYTLGYLYEHREEADHHDIVLTLRNLLFEIREGVV
ncbi:MAG: phage gp6-like head-tail connector protein [Clostridia bacterium]|nr:phage gp6-like head-tail connector protein [Clostridia bacterium]